MKFILILVALILVFIVAIAFGSGNDQVVVFNYLIARSPLRLSTLIAAAFGFGFVLAWIICGIYLFRMKLKLGSAHRQLKKLEAKETEAKQLAQKQSLDQI